MKCVTTICKLSIVLAFLLAMTDSDASERSVRKGITDAVMGLYFNDRFEELELMHADFKGQGARTPSGVWKLSVFYSAFDRFSEAVNEGEDFWEEAKAPGLRWMKAKPESAAAVLLYANILQAYAWKHRGYGYANTVSKENWQPFHEKIEQQRKFLVNKKRVASIDPQWYVEMLTIGRVQNWENAKFQALLDEGVKLYPNYYDIYFSAAEAYAPKWGGTIKLMEDLVSMAVVNTKNVDGLGLYARIYWSLGDDTMKNGFSTKTSPNWKEMKVSIEDVLSKYPDAWNYNHFAYFACLAGDYKYAQSLMDAAKWDTIPGFWQGRDALRMQCFAREAK